MKLFTIGDSISQGYMSAAAARTNLSYSRLIAQSMGFGDEYRFPEWAAGGLPANLEDIARALEARYGSNIQPWKWISVRRTIDRVLDKAEDYYERGGGAAHEPYPGGVDYFHNVAVEGFDVADAWKVTPELCQSIIDRADGGDDSFFIPNAPNAASYRTALKVLNPSLDEQYKDYSQISWLEWHAANEGVENLILWLGANNALGTVLGLDIRQTPNDPNKRPYEMTHEQRLDEKWNLWHPDDFRAEYSVLLDRVDEAMKNNEHPDWNVFVGDVPPVTVAPLIKGVGQTYDVTRKNEVTGEDDTFLYYQYYVYFPFDENIVHRNDGLYLTFEEALHIDDCIREHNTIIRALVEAKNARLEKKRYHIVNIFQFFQDIASKRNYGQAKYKFPEYFDFIYPKVDTRYYYADPDGQLHRGGLTGLDGVHPSAIGQGLLAHEFLKVMEKAGVVENANLNWGDIFASDRLYSEPISIMQEVYGHDWLALEFLKLIKIFRRVVSRLSDTEERRGS